MKKSAFAFFSVVLFLSLTACESSTQEKKESAAPVQESVTYEKAAALWAQTGATHYTMRIQYGAFSPLSGVWEIEVKDHAVIHWTFKNTKDDKDKAAFASGLTMEKLLEMAGSAGPADPDKPFRMNITYDSRNGGVSSIAKVRNPNYKKTVPTDQTFLYTVREIKILGKKGGAAQ